ncbi:MAG: DUF3108 domain-containing protein [Bacteroidota bacterium]
MTINGFLKIVCAGLFLISFAAAQDSKDLPEVIRQSDLDTLRHIPQTAFDVGERLVYDVGYSFITAGEAVFNIPPLKKYNGRDCYDIVFTVNSTSTFSLFYKVEDRYEALIDAQGLFPWQYEQHTHEGKYGFDIQVQFNPINRTAKTAKGIYKTPQYVYEAISAFFYIRAINLSHKKMGERIYLENFYNDSTYSLVVKFLGRERISVRAGKFDCIIVEPVMKEGGLFKNEGKIVIWLTNDDRKLPVKVSTKVIVGSIDAELREYSGINGPLRAKVE